MVSICVPIYNTGKYLSRCIESLRNQTYKDLEIILVDDGSTDNSGVICDEFEKIDQRIHVVHQRNKGEAAARNAGLNRASGDWVCFIDSDDEYLPNAISEMIEKADPLKYDLIVSGYYEIDEDNTHIALAHNQDYSKGEIANSILFDGGMYSDAYIFSTINSKLFKLSLIRDNNLHFDEHFVVGNDSVFFCDYLRYVNSMHNTLSAVYKYYKYNPDVRVQGMAWEYPDIFVLVSLVKNKALDLANLSTTEKEQRKIAEYMHLLNGLVNLAGYEEQLKFDLSSYLKFIREKIPCFEEAANLQCERKVINDKFRWGIPFDLVSFYVANHADEKLISVLRDLNKIRLKNNTEGRVRRLIKNID